MSYVNHNEHQDGIICFYPGKKKADIFLNTEIVGFKFFGNLKFPCDAF